MSKIHEVIPKIMAEVGAIGKNRRNQQQNYVFRGIDDAYAAFQPLFAKHGVFVVPTVLDMKREERETKTGTVLMYTILTIKHTFYADDGSCLEAITVGEAMDSGDKSCNKSESAAMKYALLEVFCVPTDEPKDTENDSPEPMPKSRIDAQERFDDAKPQDASQAVKTPQTPIQSEQQASGGDWRNFRVPFGRNKDVQLGELSGKSLLWYYENFKVESSYKKGDQTIQKKPETIAKDQAFRDALNEAYEAMVESGEIEDNVP